MEFQSSDGKESVLWVFVDLQINYWANFYFYKWTIISSTYTIMLVVSIGLYSFSLIFINFLESIDNIIVLTFSWQKQPFPNYNQGTTSKNLSHLTGNLISKPTLPALIVRNLTFLGVKMAFLQLRVPKIQVKRFQTSFSTIL